jgi:hypothetical protein
MRVLIAFSDTGGGHRAAANNLRDALQRRSEHIAVRLVDPYAMSGRWPFDEQSWLDRLRTRVGVAGAAPDLRRPARGWRA